MMKVIPSLDQLVGDSHLHAGKKKKKTTLDSKCSMCNHRKQKHHINKHKQSHLAFSRFSTETLYLETYRKGNFKNSRTTPLVENPTSHSPAYVAGFRHQVLHLLCQLGQAAQHLLTRRGRKIWKMMFLLGSAMSLYDLGKRRKTGSLYYQPKQCTTEVKYFKITTDLYCLNLPKWII